jgi:biotin-(acetyl-CoA carboxylase) ligase
MKVFIWKRLEQVSTNWHREGGLMVCASSLERAREIVKEKVDVEDYGDPVDCDAKDLDPDITYTVTEDAEERVLVFPDAGCC